MTDHADTRATARCPICRKPADGAFRPFCSRRCRDVDLNRWLSGNYVVAGKEEEDEDGLGAERKPEDGRG
ncbi:MAG: DNA gyrase inhibitor YacG [Xanthobacteraceae bacterium]|nr:DNA gyrase inhibitor YacG [Xanthobacteraceae bacterium]